MTRKRNSEATGLDEVDRTLYSTFCGAANSLSQLYTLAMNQQKLSFQAGERHALEKLYQWIMRNHEEGTMITEAVIATHIQNEMEYTGEDPLVSSRAPFLDQHIQTILHSTNSVIQTPSSLFGQPTVGLAPRSSHTNQAKGFIFANALSSLVRSSLQLYHLANGNGFHANDVQSTGNRGAWSHDSNQGQDTNFRSLIDTSMDIHTDSLPHESY